MASWPRLLDALGDDRHAERPAQGDDRGGERPFVRPIGSADELLGDLQDVGLEPAQVAERRVAGAEVVDRDANAEGARRLEPGDRRRRVVEDRGLGHLEDQLIGVEAGPLEDLRRAVDEVRLLELLRRQVHGQRERAADARPSRTIGDLAAGLLEDPGPSGTIMPVSSASGMNSFGRSSPRVGWRQRTSASTPAIDAAPEVDDRLVEQRELAPPEAARQLGAQRVAGDDRGMHRRLERRDAVLPRSLAVYIATSAFRSSSSARSVAGPRGGDADAPADLDLRVRDEERRLEGLDDPLGDGDRLAEVRRVVEQHGELVAAEATRPGRPRAGPPRIRSATSTSRRSPAACPSVSLTILKSSRSRNRTAGIRVSGREDPAPSSARHPGARRRARRTGCGWRAR